MYKILICDEDKSYIENLKGMIHECNAGKRKLEFWEFDSGEKLLEHMPADSDVVFIDVGLRGMGGNETAMRLVKTGYQGLLVQSSSASMPTPETIKISPYRYLLKQADRETTCGEIGEIFEEMDRRKACFTLDAFYRRGRVLLRTKDIVYFTHHKRGSTVHLKEECQRNYPKADLITPYNFRELLEKLHPVGFVCPHNSYLINLRYVTGFYQHKELIDLDGSMFPVARGKLEYFAGEYANYMNQKYKGQLK